MMSNCLRRIFRYCVRNKIILTMLTAKPLDLKTPAQSVMSLKPLCVVAIKQTGKFYCNAVLMHSIYSHFLIS